MSEECTHRYHELDSCPVLLKKRLVEAEKRTLAAEAKFSAWNKLNDEEQVMWKAKVAEVELREQAMRALVLEYQEDIHKKHCGEESRHCGRCEELSAALKKG